MLQANNQFRRIMLRVMLRVMDGRIARSVFCLIGLALSLSTAHAESSNGLALMPLPAHVQTGDGQLLIDGSFSVALKGYTEPRLIAAKERFLATLGRETGVPFAKESSTTDPKFTIETGAA